MNQPSPDQAPSRAPLTVLLVALLGTTIAIMDGTIIFVALPAIQRQLAASFSSVQFITTGYIAVYASLLVMGGRLGDMYGFRRLFQIGVSLFVAASLLCALAPSVEWLIAGRLIQGASAALFYPQILSTLMTAFSGSRRAWALSWFGATIGIASVGGEILGGLLVQVNLWGSSWRSIFFINLPIGLLAVLGAKRYWPVHQPSSRTRLDGRGAGLLGLALILLLVPIVTGPDVGWPWWSFLLLAGCPLAAWLFVRWERAIKRRRLPLLELDLFRGLHFRLGIILALVWFMANAGIWLILALQLQYGLHNSKPVPK